MPTIIKASPRDETAVEYQRIPLDILFLDWSVRHIELSRKAYGQPVNDEVEGALTSRHWKSHLS
jgi:hypothetical protein